MSEYEYKRAAESGVAGREAKSHERDPQTGTVFSIEEFSTFDGPGIRSTVFLKGCLMRCMWCHNPEGQEFQPQYVKNINGCTGCGRCVEAARRATGKEELTMESVDACPHGLIRLCGDSWTPEELTGRLLKNAGILHAAGGGITFSGGEPLAQPAFLLRCLSLLRGSVNCALQTSGFCSPKIFMQILQMLDYVLFDLKLMDNVLHRRYTGQPNSDILENFRLLCGSGVPFVVRIPLIPGVTDTVDNLSAIAELMHHNGASTAELLPYNRMAGGKYAMVGRHYHPDFDETRAPNPRTEIFHRVGIQTRVL